MTEEENNTPLVTDQDIKNGFKQLGIKLGDILEVHSSLSSFGKVDGGPQTVVDALIHSVGEQGIIVMSAYPLTPVLPLTEEEKTRGITWKSKVLSEDSTERTGMGVIVDTFKTRPDVVCGHGKHRVCAWGNNKEQFIVGYKHLVEEDGLVLLIGVGVDRASSLHIADEIPVPKAISDYDKVPDDIEKNYPPDQWAVGVGHGTPEDGWNKVFQKADHQGLVKHAKIGNAECHLFKAKDLVSILTEWRNRDPFDLYGVSKTSMQE